MSKRRVVTIFGTRPEIIKLSVFMEIMDRTEVDHLTIHTGQHYDYLMDEVFLKDLEIRPPTFKLEPDRRSQTSQLGEMIVKIGEILAKIEPDIVVVQGDTNTTLAGALAAKKGGHKLAHIEPGCRSFDMSMPEEQNRIIVDRLSDLLLAPTQNAMDNLAKEGIHAPLAVLTGSTITDICKRNLDIAHRKATVHFVQPYALMTIHRKANIDDSARMASILAGMAEVSKQIEVVFPVHPHTRKVIDHMIRPQDIGRIRMVEPMGYLDFLETLSAAEFVLTDSGGIQQEARLLQVPILTARKETEWIETVQCGGCILVDADTRLIADEGFALATNHEKRMKMAQSPNPYEDSGATQKIVEAIVNLLEHNRLEEDTVSIQQDE